jgi:hypothetical protein
MIENGCAGQLVREQVHHFGKPGVGIEDQSGVGEGEHPLPDILHEDLVGVISPFERVDLPGIPFLNDNSVNFPGTDRIEGLFELTNLVTQFLNFCGGVRIFLLRTFASGANVVRIFLID